jgi:type VI secretion system protein
MLALSALLTSCSLRHPAGLIGSKKMLAFQVNVAPDANQNSVVPFDVVVVRDKDLLKQIQKMDAATWFGAEGRCKFRGGPKAKVQFYSWEFVPNQTSAIDVPAMEGAKAVLGFADYSSPGEHRVTLTTKGGTMVEMGQDGVHALTIATVPSGQPAATPSKKVCPDD